MTRLCPGMRCCVLCLASLLAVGCGGGSDGPEDFNGVWDVRYNLVDDECGLVAGEIPGFVDQYQISDTDEAITVSSTTTYLSETPGVRTSDESFRAENVADVDAFGDGTPCEVSFTLTFTLRDGDEADTLFQQQLFCANGFSCVSNGAGLAVRQPDPN